MAHMSADSPGSPRIFEEPTATGCAVCCLLRCGLALVVLSVFQISAPIALAEHGRQMVLTFDDLPYQASGHPRSFAEASRVTDRLLQALARHDAPATAFVNESKLTIDNESDGRRKLLEDWASSGAILGNHTYSHADLNLVTVEEYQREIVNGEPITTEVMSIRPDYQKYFRHPYTHTGDTKAKQQQITEFLVGRGYRIAPYTIDSQDSVFNRIYLDARNARDADRAKIIQSAYVEFVIAATDFAEGVSVKIFGEDIPQTLLLHANSINADTLEDLLGRLAQRGYGFIRLDEAMQHEAYKTSDDLVTAYGPSWLWRWNKSLGLGISFRGDPEPPDWVLEMFESSSVTDE